MEQSSYEVTTVTQAPSTSTEFRGWLEKLATEHNLRWLLAHHDDGVNWGEYKENRLSVSHDVAGATEYVPEFLPGTLQQLRFFGPKAELLLWQTEEGLKGRILSDLNNEHGPATLDQRHLLWGVQTDEIFDGDYITVSEADGLCHVVPWPDRQTQPGPRQNPTHRLHLTVRHYVAYDNDGQAYVEASRLVELGSHVRGKEV